MKHEKMNPAALGDAGGARNSICLAAIGSENNPQSPEFQGFRQSADARDAAVCLSISLQHGVAPETVRAAVLRDSQGETSGIIGAVLDLIAEEGGR